MFKSRGGRRKEKRFLSVLDTSLLSGDSQIENIKIICLNTGCAVIDFIGKNDFNLDICLSITLNFKK